MVMFGVVNEIKRAIFSSCLELGINRKFWDFFFVPSLIRENKWFVRSVTLHTLSYVCNSIFYKPFKPVDFITDDPFRWLKIYKNILYLGFRRYARAYVLVWSLRPICVSKIHVKDCQYDVDYRHRLIIKLMLTLQGKKLPLCSLAAADNIVRILIHCCVHLRHNKVNSFQSKFEKDYVIQSPSRNLNDVLKMYSVFNFGRS